MRLPRLHLRTRRYQPPSIAKCEDLTLPVFLSGPFLSVKSEPFQVGDVMSRELVKVERRESNQEDLNRGLIAPLRHTVRIIAILALLGVAGTVLQTHLHSQASSKAPGALASHKSVVSVYLSLIFGEWWLLFAVWRGIRVRWLKLRDLIGGSWTSTKRISTDMLLGAGIWLVSLFAIWVLLARFLASRSPHGHPGNARFHYNIFEGVLCVLSSVGAGFCEEVAYRGYLQRQFRALTGNSGAAVLIQAIVFGFPHAFEGLAAAIAAGIFGLLVGLVAWWRKNLRPGMVAHAWTDIFLNLLPKVFWRFAAILKI